MSKLLLTTSSEGMVIIADVPTNHSKSKSEMFVSEGFLKANLKNFQNMTNKVEWDGRIFVLKSDLRVDK
jgi:hypothetical protein